MTAGPGSLADHVAQAVQALTAAASASYSTPSGPQRCDFGEIACRVLTAVAANLGGVEALLAGRPGSWEADAVRHLVHSTTPEEGLWAYRTVPVRLRLNPVEVLTDLGIWDLYWQDYDAVLDHYGDYPDDDQVAAINAELDALTVLWQADLSGYAAAYTDTVRGAAAELGLTVPVEVEMVSVGGDPDWWDALAGQLHETARAATPLPTSGLAPRDYPGPGLPGEIDRAAGRTYLARLQQHGGAR